MPFEPFQIVVGAVLGFTSAGGLRWWQYRRDFWLARVEQFCTTADKGADVATEYWLQKKVLTAENSGELTSLELKEAALLGLQMRLDGIFAHFEPRLLRAGSTQIQNLMNDLTDAMTGGQFEAASRPPDRERAWLAQMYASELILATRAAAMEAITVAGWARFALERVQQWRKAAVGEVPSTR